MVDMKEKVKDLEITALNEIEYKYREVLKSLKDCKLKLIDVGLNADIFGDLQQNIKQSLDIVEAETGERKVEAAPYSRACTERIFEIPKEINQIKYKLESGKATVSKKHDAMLGAGIKQDEVLRLVPDYDDMEDLRLIKELELEETQWGYFSKTERLKDLPKDADKHATRIGLYQSQIDQGIAPIQS